jgi:ATP-dependent protease ClpP protease subunit
MPKHPYRFRGAIQPSASVKRPVRAELTGETDGTTAKLYLYDVIDSWGGDWGISAKEFNTALNELGDVSQINLHVNSPGGECYEGIAILNALRRHPANVTAVVDGIAASAASFIACGADEVVMARNSEMMIHDAWGIALGPAADMRSMADQLDKISNNIASVYAAKSAGSVETWREFMLAETWYSDAEAVAAGLADRIEGAEDDALDPGEIENAFDLTVFKNAGRTAAPAPKLDVGPAEEPEGEVHDLAAERARRQRQNKNRVSLLARRAGAVSR